MVTDCKRMSICQDLVESTQFRANPEWRWVECSCNLLPRLIFKTNR